MDASPVLTWNSSATCGSSGSATRMVATETKAAALSSAIGRPSAASPFSGKADGSAAGGAGGSGRALKRRAPVARSPEPLAPASCHSSAAMRIGASSAGAGPAISSRSLRRTASAKRSSPSAVTTKLAGPPMMVSANACSRS